jgi:hypothetical protein
VNYYEMNLAIVGSRDFTDYDWFTQQVEQILNEWDTETESIKCIISGGARGVDSLAKRYATEHDIKLIEFPADWQKFGKSAGPKRNTQIVEACDHLIAFPSKEGRGTQDSIAKAEKAGVVTHVVFVD